jgi:hypothetical protein
MGYQTTLVQMDYNYATMLSADDPVYLDNLRFKQVFGDEANGIVVGIINKNFFALNDFTKLQNLSRDLKKIKNVSAVLSINSAVNIKQVTVKDENGVNKRIFETYNLFPEKIENQLELDSLKDVFLSLPFYNGLLYNQSTHVYLMVISIDKQILNSPERIPTVKEIEKVVRNYAEVNNVEIHISGQPYIRTQMMGLVQREVKLFIFLAIAICIIILYLFFRSFKVIGVALIVIGVSVLWTIGLMGLCHYKITILSGMIPPLLIVIGIPNTIFLSNKFHSEAKSHGNKILALQRVISKIGNAVFLSNATTAAGFATFIITNSNLLVEFGVIASVGVMITFVVALIIIPSIFSFLQPPSEKYTKHLTNKHITKIIDTIINIVHNHRRKVYFTVIAVLIAAGFGVTLIKKTGFLLDDIPKSDPIYVDLKFLEKNFNGVFPIEILIESRDSLQGSELIYQIQKIDSLQQRLTKYPELSRSMSVADAVKFLYQSYSKGNQENYMLPADPKTYETIFKRLPNGLDQKLAKSFIDSTNTITRISLNIADIGTNRMEVLIPKIKKDIHDIFPDKNYKSLITGSTVLYFTGTTYLINNLFGSLILAIIIIGLLMFGLQRSPKIVGIALVPNLIPMIVTAALMGYFGIPIKPSTILVFGIALGISVDGTIHFLTKYRQEMLANDMNISYSVQRALRETGPSLMYTGVILFFGFMIFTFSGFGGTVALGFLISMTLLVAMIGNLLLLPTLLISLEKYIKKKELLNPMFEISDDTDDCDSEMETDDDENENEKL